MFTVLIGQLQFGFCFDLILFQGLTKLLGIFLDTPTNWPFGLKEYPLN